MGEKVFVCDITSVVEWALQIQVIIYYFKICQVCQTRDIVLGCPAHDLFNSNLFNQHNDKIAFLDRSNECDIG